MKVIAIIPARMASTRYPGKPMENIHGKPMIEHVFERVSKNQHLDMVVVATCDKVIYDHMKSVGGDAIMTSDLHVRASDRCAEALLKLENDRNCKYDVVVMVQGDEPMTHPDMITEALSPFKNDASVQITNLMHEIGTDDEFNDPNTIKVVCDDESNALYFSRSPIPYGQSDKPRMKQVCVIPFRRDFLLHYTDLVPTPLEIAESVDMMRVLEHGKSVRMVITKHQSQAVDTPEDLNKVSRLLKTSN